MLDNGNSGNFDETTERTFAMSKMTPKEMAKHIGSGLLSFPVTPFKPDYSFDEAQYRANIDWLCGYDVAGLFAAGGTGEFFSLTPPEVAKVVVGGRRRKPGAGCPCWPGPVTERPLPGKSRWPRNAPAPMACCCCRPIWSIPSRKA